MSSLVELRDGGVLLYDPSFLSGPAADAAFAILLQTLPWHSETIRGRPVPRRVTFIADVGVSYTYSRLAHVGVGWPTELVELRERVSAAAAVRFNSVLANHYRDGRDSMGFHADDEPELGSDPVIGSLSLGAERTFVLRHNTSGDRLKYRLGHGSLLVMGGTCQRYWQHAVPKTTAEIGGRINLTFRRVVPPPPAPPHQP